MASSSSSSGPPGLTAYKQMMSYKSSSNLAAAIIQEECTTQSRTASTDLPPLAHNSELSSLEDELDCIIDSIPVRGKSCEMSFNVDSDDEDEGGLLVKRTQLGKTVCVSITDRPAETRSAEKAKTVTMPKAAGQKRESRKSKTMGDAVALDTDVEAKTAGGASFCVRRVSAPEISLEPRPAEPTSPRSDKSPVKAKTGQKVIYFKSKTTEKLEAEANLNADIDSGSGIGSFLRRVSAPEILAFRGPAEPNSPRFNKSMVKAKTGQKVINRKLKTTERLEADLNADIVSGSGVGTFTRRVSAPEFLTFHGSSTPARAKTSGKKVACGKSKSTESSEANLNSDIDGEASCDVSSFVRRVSCPEASAPKRSKPDATDTAHGNGARKNRAVSLTGPVSMQEVQAAVDLHITASICRHRSRRPSRSFGELFRRCKEKCPNFKKTEDGKNVAAAWDGFSAGLVPTAGDADGTCSFELGGDSTPRSRKGRRLCTAGTGSSELGGDSTPSSRAGGDSTPSSRKGRRLSSAGQSLASRIRGRTSSRVIQFEV